MKMVKQGQNSRTSAVDGSKIIRKGKGQAVGPQEERLGLPLRRGVLRHDGWFNLV